MLSIKLLIAIAFFGTACFLDLRDFTDFIYSVSILTTNLGIKRSAPQFSFLEYLAVTYLLMIVKWAMIYVNSDSKASSSFLTCSFWPSLQALYSHFKS